MGGMLLSGCGDEPAASSEAALPEATPIATLPPGTPITDWLTVPQGTVLLGSAFPYPDGGARALLLVTGDPLEAVADLGEQIYNAGYRWSPLESPSDNDYVCEIRSGDWNNPDEIFPVSAELPDGPSWLYCEGYAALPVEENHQWQATFELLVGTESDPYLSHLYVNVERVFMDGSGLGTVDTPLVVPEGPSPVTPPSYPDSMPGPGDAIGAEFFHNGEEYPLLEGSRLTAPPLWVDCTGGFYAVIELNEAEVEDYVTEYQQEFGGERDIDEEFTHGETRVVYQRYHIGGGGYLALHAVDPSEQPAYLLVYRCDD